MNMCIAYVGEGPVICIKPTKLKQYYYTLLTVTVYENGYFKKIDLAVYYPVKKGGHKCSMSGNGNMFVKEDSDYNLYIHNKTLNNINYCVSICKSQKQNTHFGKNKIPPKCDKLSSILTFQTAFKFL